MHADEREKAVELLTSPEEADGYVLGAIDEQSIAELRDEGLTVEVLDEIPLQQRGVLAHRRGPAEPPARRITTDNAEDQEDYLLLELDGPLLEERRSKLSAHGIELVESVGPFTYVAHRVDQDDSVRDLSFVRSVAPFPTETASQRLVPNAPEPPIGDARVLTFDIRLHRKEDREPILQWIASRGIEVIGSQGRLVRVSLGSADPLLQQIRSLPQVSSVKTYSPARLMNDRARLLVEIDRRDEPDELVLHQTGQGQIVGVADTGFDMDHRDFEGRVVDVKAHGRPNDCKDYHGHGTHVAGSILGSGLASGGKYRGAAPGARLFFQSVGIDCTDGSPGCLDLDEPGKVYKLLKEAYDAGARIHNDSWGEACCRSGYNANSEAIDEFMWNYPDMLVVVAAGNAGDARDPVFSEKGYVDHYSICAPGTAKNALVVGASRSDRAEGGVAQCKWSDLYIEFPDLPIADEFVSGNPEAMAAYSSRGPCDCGRIKPDVVAPGTNKVSTRSTLAPRDCLHGVCPGYEGKYVYGGGTSSAAPTAAGCAALIREYYESSRERYPSAALVKATLINGAKWLTGADSVADHPLPPNFHQGFGCIFMPHTIPNPMAPDFKLDFVDSWMNPALQFSAAGEAFRFRIRAMPGYPLRVCLVYTDLPGESLQNDLHLLVEREVDRHRWIGNEDEPFSTGGHDCCNNVEVVRIDNPQEGDYRLDVIARDLLEGPQAFALVVSGCLDSPLSSIDVLG